MVATKRERKEQELRRALADELAARRRRRWVVLAAVLAAAFFAGAVALVLTLERGADPRAADGGATGPAGADRPEDGDDAPVAEEGAVEEASWSPRVAVAHDSGVLLLDAVTLETVADVPVEGLTALHPAGDGRHVLASTPAGFRVVDAGTFADAHGDHAHYYTTTPRLTDATWPASRAGTVTDGADHTVLFDDGTGSATVVSAPEVGAGPGSGYLPREVSAGSPHAGVAVRLSDGGVLVSQGDGGTATGLRLVDDAGAEVGSAPCADLRGAGVAAGDAVVVGCADGALVHAGGRFTSVPGTPGGRITSLLGSEASPVVLGGHVRGDRDPAGDGGPTRVSLVDTRTATLRLVDLPAAYGAGSLARGDAGEALVLGVDGSLHVVDAETGTLDRSLPVIDPWELPEVPGAALPGVVVLYGSAFVSDPFTRTVRAVDLASGDVWLSTDLAVTPRGLLGVSGDTEYSPGG